MPPIKTLKIEGGKIVPANRFNLGPAKPSTSFLGFLKDTLKEVITSVLIEHPFVKSVTVEDKPATLVNQPEITVAVDEQLPFINTESQITLESEFKDFHHANKTWVFPKIELTPFNNSVFYYEEILSEKGLPQGYEGYVNLKYIIIPKPGSDTFRNIPLNLKEAVLNLKAGSEPIKISGIIDKGNSSIRFNLMNEALKIAFFNLISEFESKRCSLVLYFDFKGYCTSKGTFRFARKINPELLSRRKLTRMNGPAINTTVKNAQLISFSRKSLAMNVPLKKMVISTPLRRNNLEVQPVEKVNPEITVQPTTIKTTFLLLHSQTIHFALGTNASACLFKTSSGGITANPFNLNPGYSEFCQIFLPEIEFNKVAIYKSMVQPNTFLLIAKNYYLTRTEDTLDPCILSIFHASEEGTSTSLEISEIEFQFAIGPDLSNYELAWLKYLLMKNQQIEMKTGDFMNDINFIFPQDVEAEFQVIGNQFLQKSDVSVDGKYFVFSLFTENLSEASILINSLNNAASQYANITFRYKEIADTSTIDINIEKTIGDVISSQIENDNLTIQNLSLSECKLRKALSIDTNNNFAFNQTYFNNFDTLQSGDKKTIPLSSFIQSTQTGTIKAILFDLESIENLSKEFEQIASQTTDYNRYVTIKFDNQKSRTEKIQLQIVVEATGNVFRFVRLKNDFKTPFLFNFIILNSVDAGSSKLIIDSEYHDANDNVTSKQQLLFDFSKSSILTIPA